MARRLRVLSLNLLNIADRWTERLPLLREGFASLDPDIAGFQETFYPIDQERLIAASSPDAWDLRRARADRPERGNSLLVRSSLGGIVAPAERLTLAHGRSALRTLVELGTLRLQVAVTHLHHIPADESIRKHQVETLVDWLNTAPPVDATIVIGDFNAEPDEPAARRMVGAGYRSSFAEATGADPLITFPSGLQAPGREYYEGWPEGCFDYIWISGNIRASSARLCFDRPAAHDSSLFASDHRGVLAELEVG
jgi:endonuclease/exonuclease/phosphatase family metal-dependent hydrolase